MCGICGKFDVNERVEPSLIKGMCDTLLHRGPDDAGLYVKSPIGLGNRRLAIIDLSDAGHMPMSTTSGRLWITYNGEVYNYKEIRAELQGYGYQFQSNTDTEVVLYAYDNWGPDCLRRFNGMFALAIWDQKKQQLFLARDHIGIKPLYYYFDASKIIFASEIKAILQDSEVSRELSPEGITNYFTFGHSVAPRTIFKNIHKLCPGHYLTCSLEGDVRLQIKIKRYWAPPAPGQSEDAGEKYYVEGVYRLLRESVRRQLVSDVPLGVFLSGGIDSSIITSLMSSIDPSQVKTFSIGFNIGGKTYNELDDARLVARHFGTEHHELLLDENDLTQALPSLIYHYDEPFGDPASFPTYLLSKFAREYVTVSLSGEGGDEIFGGYRRYVVENFLAHYPMLVGLLNNKVARKSLANIPRFGRWQKLILQALGAQGDVERYASWLSIFNKEMRAELFRGNTIPLTDFDPLDVYRHLYTRNGAKRVDHLMHIDQQTWLPDTYLEKADKASMAVSLEVRVPFLDHELVEFAATIPAKYKVRGLSTKCILKKAFLSQLPEETLRKRKHGFEVPLNPWIAKKLRFVPEILFDHRARSRGLFDQEYIQKLYRWHTEGKGLYHDHLWLLIVFELWCQRFLDGQPHTNIISK